MSTAELDHPTEERLVSRPEEGTLYMSRRNELRLVKSPTRSRFNAEGSKIETIQGESVTFRDGALRLPTGGKATIDAGLRVSVDELRTWLEDHRAFGDREEGFWRVDPVAPPVDGGELERLTEITTDLDIPRLEAFIAQEEEGWARPRLLKAAEAALARVNEAMTRLRAEERDALDRAREEGRSEGAQGVPGDTAAVVEPDPTAPSPPMGSAIEDTK